MSVYTIGQTKVGRGMEGAVSRVGLPGNVTDGDGVMTVAVILVVSSKSGRRPSGYHEAGPG
jgi:hypothetical protein